jgi:hypothetical protein
VQVGGHNGIQVSKYVIVASNYGIVAGHSDRQDRCVLGIGGFRAGRSVR